MKPEIARAWVEAMRSGDYERGVNQLKLERSGKFYFCPAGVLCDLAERAGVTDSAYQSYGIWGYKGNHDYMSMMVPVCVLKWAGMDLNRPLSVNVLGTQQSVYVLNDEHDYSLEMIAQLVEDTYL